jgi:hypothetical protein
LGGRGYAVSENDPCVWRRVVDGVICIILIYVDDLLIFGNQEEMDGLSALLTSSFSAITMTVGRELSYLGMQIEWTAAGFQVSMEFYIEQMLVDWPSVLFRASPGTKDTYKIDGESRLLAETERKLFHSAVARVLYLAKHVRPDALTVVSFLCTRVTVATEQDQEKLERLLGYFKATKARKFYIRVSGVEDMQVRMFVDAAFALHWDSKSHTGTVVTVGGAVVFVASGKQKCVVKSPTEAELVGLTDKMSFAELVWELVCFLVGKCLPVPVIYQDSTSVISLITQGGGVARTKHLRARINLAKEMLEEKRAVVKYLKTTEMPADGVSKVLEGKPHRRFADFVLGVTMFNG